MWRHLTSTIFVLFLFAGAAFAQGKANPQSVSQNHRSGTAKASLSDVSATADPAGDNGTELRQEVGSEIETEIETGPVPVSAGTEKRQATVSHLPEPKGVPQNTKDGNR